LPLDNLARGFGTKFYRPDDIPNANKQKTLGCTFSACTTTPGLEGTSLAFASALGHRGVVNSTTFFRENEARQ